MWKSEQEVRRENTRNYVSDKGDSLHNELKRSAQDFAFSQDGGVERYEDRLDAADCCQVDVASPCIVHFHGFRCV